MRPEIDHGYVVAGEEPPETVYGRQYSVQVCEAAATMAKPDCEAARTISLSADYYEGDRAMRESGFDVSFRFGPYSAATQHFAPVCLNSLLYKTETDLARMSEILGRKDEAAKWKQRAEEREALMVKYFWDAERGMFFDYDFEKKERSAYVYITTFYPLWAGLATPEQARAVVHNLKLIERPGGIAMSPVETGAQWDYPYAWAPMQLIADEGMRRYGFDEDSNRASYEFISAVAENFRRDGTIREKYNAVTRSDETHVTAGYQANVIGFGWTNGVFLVLLHDLPQDWVERLAKEQGQTKAAIQ
jgi:alpha,alpha-trehalase